MEANVTSISAFCVDYFILALFFLLLGIAKSEAIAQPQSKWSHMCEVMHDNDEIFRFVFIAVDLLLRFHEAHHPSH